MKGIITASIWGNSYDLEYRIGSTIYHDHFDTQEEAVMFCRANGIEFEFIAY